MKDPGFRDREKQRQSDLFGNDSLGGFYGDIDKPLSFCLREGRNNLFISHRDSAIQYFCNRKIPWHDGGTKIYKHDLPSNHLCCSQSCCVNFNFPFMNDNEGLKRFLISLGYSVKEVLPVYLDDDENESFQNYVGFEWIGANDYLNELATRRTSRRTRGEKFTSADFIMRFRQNDDKIRILLGEWKYTEEYTKCTNKSMRHSKYGTDRLDKIYRQILESTKCQIIIEHDEHEHLFYDPFDQLMRLQLLSTEMEEAHEMDADIVSTVHIVPKANEEFNTEITSPELRKYGDTVHSIWGKLVDEDRFRGFFLEDILPEYCKSYHDDGIRKYIQHRYGNMK